MRVCLISPGHLSTNPRLVKEARALRAAGHTVYVVCGRFKRWGTENDKPFAAELGTVTSVPFGPSEASRQTYLRQSIIRHTARVLVGLGFKSHSFVETAHSPVVRDLAAAARTVRADLYIAHYVAALPAAAHAAARHGAAYAFDAEDFHLGDLPDAPEHALEKRIIHAIESRYLPGTAYMTAASPLIAEAYAETYGVSLPTVILNVFPKANAPTAPTPRGSVEPGPSVYWFSQTIGPGRGLETAVEAIAQAQSRPHLYLRGTPAAGYEAYLSSLATRARVADRLHFLDCAPPDKLERLGASYDLGYCGETDFSRNRLCALTNKVFSYLLGGVPSLVTDIPAHRQLAPQLGEAMTLFPIGDVAVLAAAIDRLLLDPQRLATARAHAWRLGQTRFNWDVEQTTLLRTIISGVGVLDAHT
jgi:glycosyltransferase involved in cell wall biosynthesis